MANRVSCGYEIAPAIDGGFFVMTSRPFGDFSNIAFAGTLPECLEYLRGKLTAPVAGEAQQQAA